MEIGDKAMVSPQLTNEKYWIDGEIIDIEQNPFKGIVIAIRDESGRIFFGEEKYFIRIDCVYEPNETTLEAIREVRARKFAGTIDTSSLEAFIKSFDDL